MVLRINVLWYSGVILDSNRLFVTKNWTSMPSASRSYGRQVGWQASRLTDKIRLDCEILKIFYRLNYLDFYFVYSSEMLLIVLEVHFSRLLASKAYFKVCFEVRKFRLSFFISIPTIRYY